MKPVSCKMCTQLKNLLYRRHYSRFEKDRTIINFNYCPMTINIFLIIDFPLCRNPEICPFDIKNWSDGQKKNFEQKKKKIFFFGKKKFFF